MNKRGLTFVSLMVVATVQGQNLYWGGGNADLPDNTALPQSRTDFAGTWKASTKNWATTNTPSTYTSYVNGGIVDLGYVTNVTGNGGKVAITNDADFSLSGLMSVTRGDHVNQRIVLTATSPHTLTFTGSDFLLNAHSFDYSGGLLFDANVSLAGTSTVHSTATLGRVEVASASDGLTGPIRIRDTSFSLNGGTMAGVTDWRPLCQLYFGAYAPSFSYPALIVTRWTTAAKNQLADNAVVSLNNGGFTYTGYDHASTPSSETLGKLVIEPYGRLDLSSVLGATVGSPSPKLILSDATTGLDRGSNGRGTMIVYVASATWSGVPIGYPATDLIVSNGVTTDVLLPWVASSFGEFMRVNGTTKVLELVPSTLAPTDPNTWVAGTNYRCGTNDAWVATAALTNDLTINSLGFMPRTSACTLTLTSNKTLTITSGALSRMAAQGVWVDTLITNGTLTSSSGQLTVLSEGTYGSFTIASRISGSEMELIKGGGLVTLAGPDSNTYDGTTYICGELKASKSGGAIAIPGNLVIQNGGKFTFSGTAPISATSAVTIEEGGVWQAGTFTHTAPVNIKGGCYYLQNTSPAFAASGTGLLFDGGKIVHYSTAYGSLSLQTDVSYASTATKQARWEQFVGNTGSFGLELDGAQRTFNIADSSSLATNVPEMVIDTRIYPGSPAGGSLRKTGDGVLQLTDDNTYTGGTVIDGGTLQISTIRAPAQTNLTAVFNNGTPMLTFNQPVATNMVVRQVLRSASNTGLTDLRYVSEILNPYQITLNSTGAAARPSDIIANAISRSGNLGTGPAIVNNTGTLKIDAGIGLTNAVAVTSGGTISASGAGIGRLSITNGTFVATLAAGALSVSNTVSLSGATLSLSGKVNNEPTTILTASSITGKFASVPESLSVLYYPTSITVGKIKGTILVVR